MNNRVAFIAAPYGFGPSSKAIAVSSHLGRSIEADYYGDGPPLDMAKSSNQFSQCLRLDFTQPAEDVSTLLSAYKVLVFVNTMRYIPSLSMRYDSIVYIDTLAWLRDEQPACLNSIKACFAQKFFRYSESPDRMMSGRYCQTSAIVPRTLSCACCPGGDRISACNKSPIVHCGGLYSPVMYDGADVAFVECLYDAMRDVPSPLRVILPRHLQDHFRDINSALSVIDCSPVSVHEHIAGSVFALTTSGIEFTYECVSLGVPVIFLPPFNASQYLQLKYYEQAFHGSISFQLDDDMLKPKSSMLDEATALIQEKGVQGVWREQFASIGSCLEDYLQGDAADPALREVGDRQQTEMRAVGNGGAEVVAQRIVVELFGG